MTKPLNPRMQCDDIETIVGIWDGYLADEAGDRNRNLSEDELFIQLAMVEKGKTMSRPCKEAKKTLIVFEWLFDTGRTAIPVDVRKIAGLEP